MVPCRTSKATGEARFDTSAMRRVLLLIAALALLAAPAAAWGSGDDVVRDCTAHGHLTKRYQAAEYRDALVSIPADEREYGNCYDVIRHAEVKVVGHATGGPGSGGRPSGGSVSSSGGGLPTPLLVLLILLAAGAVAGAAVAVRSRALRDRGT